MKSITLNVPELFDKKVISEWIAEGTVLKEYVNEDNYCLFVMFGREKPTYQYLRFFTVQERDEVNIGALLNTFNTFVSVDYDSSRHDKELVIDLADMLNSKWDR